MENKAFKIERTFTVPITRAWKAITNKDEMKLWYFDLPEFKPEVGCEFQFWGGPTEDRQYKHLCRVEEVIPNRKIAYSWKYEGYAGHTLVSFNLSENEGQTTVTLTHEGLETFPEDEPDFARKNFEEGWSWIIGTSLKEYLEKNV